MNPFPYYPARQSGAKGGARGLEGAPPFRLRAARGGLQATRRRTNRKNLRRPGNPGRPGADRFRASGTAWRGPGGPRRPGVGPGPKPNQFAGRVAFQFLPPPPTAAEAGFFNWEELAKNLRQGQRRSSPKGDPRRCSQNEAVHAQGDRTLGVRGSPICGLDDVTTVSPVQESGKN